MASVKPAPDKKATMAPRIIEMVCDDVVALVVEELE